MLQQLYKKVKQLVSTLNAFGVPVPMVRDPKTGCGSVSLTLVFISSILVMIGCAGKWSGLFGEVDFHEALDFFFASSALYFGRNWVKGGGISKDAVDSSDSPKDDVPPPAK